MGRDVLNFQLQPVLLVWNIWVKKEGSGQCWLSELCYQARYADGRPYITLESSDYQVLLNPQNADQHELIVLI